MKEELKLVPVAEVVKKANVKYRTLNYYMSIGLIPKNKRIKGHHRHIWGYPQGTIERVKKIRAYIKRQTLQDLLDNPELLK